jgi:hypothetical protein
MDIAKKLGVGCITLLINAINMQAIQTVYGIRNGIIVISKGVRITTRMRLARTQATVSTVYGTLNTAIVMKRAAGIIQMKRIAVMFHNVDGAILKAVAIVTSLPVGITM